MNVDFSDEFLKLYNDGLSLNEIDEHLTNQIEVLESKKYVLKIMEMINQIDSLIKAGYEAHNLKKYEFFIMPWENNKILSTRNVKLSNAINFSFVNQNKTIIPSSSNEVLSKIKDVIDCFPLYKHSLVGELQNLSPSNGITFPLLNSDEKLKKLLIEEKLLICYNYSSLNFKTNNKQQVNNFISKI